MKKLFMGVLAAGTLVASAPLAQADHVQGQCRTNAVWSEAASQPDEFSGAIYGAFAAAGDIEVNCYIQVNGVRDTDTDLDVDGTGVAANARDITYIAAEGDVVEICTEVVKPEPGHTTCVTLGLIEFPPPIVEELLILITSIPDPILCPILASLSPGVPGVIDIDSEGDVAIGGIDFWDCPPYGS